MFLRSYKICFHTVIRLPTYMYCYISLFYRNYIYFQKWYGHKGRPHRRPITSKWTLAATIHIPYISHRERIFCHKEDMLDVLEDSKLQIMLLICRGKRCKILIKVQHTKKTFIDNSNNLLICFLSIQKNLGIERHKLYTIFILRDKAWDYRYSLGTYYYYY